MAASSWRCSQCGTINEPDATSCRTCGRWPSLFELEGSSLEDVRTTSATGEAAVEAQQFEPEIYEIEGIPVETDEEAEPESPADRRRKILTSLIVPLAFAVYLLISLFLGDRG